MALGGKQTGGVLGGELPAQPSKAVQDRAVVHLRGRIDPRLYEAILALIQIRDSAKYANLLPNEANELLRFITLYFGGHDACVSSGGEAARAGLQTGEGLPRDSDCAAGVVGDLGHHLSLASGTFIADEFWLAWWFSRYHADKLGIYADTPLNQELAIQVWRGLTPERISTAMESIGEQLRRRSAD